MSAQRFGWRRLRIRFATIEQCYGRGNFDDAGDAIVAELNALADYPGQYACRFGEDCAHDNPWFHALIVEVAGLPDARCREWLGRVVALGLDDAQFDP